MKHWRRWKRRRWGKRWASYLQNRRASGSAKMIREVTRTTCKNSIRNNRSSIRNNNTTNVLNIKEMWDTEYLTFLKRDLFYIGISSQVLYNLPFILHLVLTYIIWGFILLNFNYYSSEINRDGNNRENRL